MDFAAILAAYSVRFHAGLQTGLSSERNGNEVSSPLGAWLLLAVNAHLADEATRPVLEAALGCDIASAKTFAEQMLTEVPSSLGLAMALWSRTKALSDTFAQACATLPSLVATGKIPTQKAANAWAVEKTTGLITEFPVTIGSDTVLTLASALATHATWAQPFRLVDASELRTASDGWSAVSKVLLSVRGHDVFLARTSAGLCAAHVVYSASGSAVVSVLCDEGVSPAAALAAAHEVARLVSGRSSTDSVATKVSLFDLWTGALLGGCCNITEGNFRTEQAGERRERGSAFLPAWQADQKYDLLASDVGFSIVADVWTPFLSPKLRPAVIEAAQSCVTSYTQHGFDAAAITAVSMMASTSMPVKPPHKAVERVLKVRFSRPFAVTSIVLTDDSHPSCWAGLPVFDGWVTVPTEPLPV